MISDDERPQQPDRPGDDAPQGPSSGSPGPVTPRQLLRTALVDDQDPRFPRWLPIPGALLGLGWAAYQATAGDAGFLPTLGVSTAIFAGTTVAAWLGWQLEID